MKGKLFYSLVAAAVVAGSAAAMGIAVERLPSGKWRDAAERYLLAPGHEVYERFGSDPRFRKWRKKADKQVEAGREKLAEVQEAVEEKAEELGAPALYNTAAWAAAGFLLCFLGTLILGVSSLKSAVSLGVKATLFLLFLQGALVFAGFLAYRRVKGG